MLTLRRYSIPGHPIEICRSLRGREKSAAMGQLFVCCIARLCGEGNILDFPRSECVGQSLPWRGSVNGPRESQGGEKYSLVFRFSNSSSHAGDVRCIPI